MRRWETSAEETLSSSIKRAILSKNLPAPTDIRMHITLQEGIITHFKSTRNAILSYVLSLQTWHGSICRAPDNDATNDMEIGAVLGKGKGKKGKDKKGDR